MELQEFKGFLSDLTSIIEPLNVFPKQLSLYL